MRRDVIRSSERVASPGTSGTLVEAWYPRRSVMKAETARFLAGAPMLVIALGCAPAAPTSTAPAAPPHGTTLPASTQSSVAASVPGHRLAHAASHTCVVANDDALYCWGQNSLGQLGLAEPNLVTAATRVPGLPKVVAVAVDDLSTCAVGVDGGLYCFGYTWTKAGRGAALKTPTRVPGFEGVVSVALGTEHRCALFSSGEVACFGGDVDLLGGRTDETPERAAIVEGLPPLTSVVASDHGTCGLDAGGAVWCFGTQTCGAKQPTPGKPYRVSEIDGLTSVSLADDALCGITATHAARCVRCMTDDDRDERDVIRFPEMADARAISAETRRGCVVDGAGRASCWGSLRRGGRWGYEPRVIGPPPTLTPRPDLSHVVELSVTAASGCALGGDGLVRCWGENHKGELGAGSVPWSPTPTEHGLGKGEYAVIAAAGNVTCALVHDGRVECFGELDPEAAATMQAVRGGSYLYSSGLEICVHLEDDHERRCVSVRAGLTPMKLAEPITLVPSSTVTTTAGTCALVEGAVECYPRTEPSPLLGNLNKLRARQIVFGRDHACALLANGTVRCAGDNAHGQLGRAGPGGITPSAVAGLRDVERIVANDNQTCANTSNGDLFCWGIDEAIGAIAGVDGRKPRRLMQNVFDLVAGARHFCAQATDGKLWCWGSDEQGQLGDSSERAYQVAPAVVHFADRPRQIAAGARHTCALFDGGTVRCWGNNDFGQLGDIVARRYNDRAFVVVGLPRRL